MKKTQKAIDADRLAYCENKIAALEKSLDDTMIMNNTLGEAVDSLSRSMRSFGESMSNLVKKLKNSDKEIVELNDVAGYVYHEVEEMKEFIEFVMGTLNSAGMLNRTIPYTMQKSEKDKKEKPN